ncbi:hypothetical protein AB4Y32_01140 [Paraburkholderia phymatum]|uniref:Uncharacterized protein n=1 Tax=Paraburkholderia phymatum TaxID=148447 RepID=A0ACC6TSL7_9BURK
MGSPVFVKKGVAVRRGARRSVSVIRLNRRANLGWTNLCGPFLRTKIAVLIAGISDWIVWSTFGLISVADASCFRNAANLRAGLEARGFYSTGNEAKRIRCTMTRCRNEDEI